MREDDEFGHYVPLLRRIIILVAVITAVPVVLWTITAFVRTYVGPPRMPTFHQLAATASINGPTSLLSPDGTAQLQAAMQAKLAGQSAPAAVEPGANATDAHDAVPIAPKGSFLSDRPESDTGASATAQGLPAMAGTSVMARGADVFPPSSLPATTDSRAPSSTGALAAASPPTATEPANDILPVSAPLSGRIPLPRPRPRVMDTVRTADMAPSNIPMPRPRPDAAGAGAQTEPAAASPIEFLQNLFH